VREIQASTITETVKDLFLSANYYIGSDICNGLKCALEKETSLIGQSVLEQIIENNVIAADDKVPICQDTGMAVIFVEVGQDVHIVGNFEDAMNEGVRQAYLEGYMRKSVVEDPLFNRVNTKDNTPAIIHTKIIPGDKISILVMPKGFGSENMSAVRMLKPSQGVEGVMDFVLETVKIAGPNPCPPIVVGIGIGGTLEKACLLAKKATARNIDIHNTAPEYAELESKLLTKINKLGIGPGGMGGNTTALAVNIECYPTHIAGLPVAVNICCHAARHASAVL